jgi:peptidoglycan/LPS O-acetylase OafA/YrhL
MTEFQSVGTPVLHKARINTVDGLLGLRAFACLMVVVIHCSPPAQTLQLAGQDWTWLIFSNGFVAVWIFFALSGYLMGKGFFTGRYAYTGSGIKRFWWNRLLRIGPLYGFAVVMLAIFVYPTILQVDHWGTLLRVLTFTYQSHVTPDDVVFDGALWSLSTEVQFYVIVPLIYGVCRPLVASWRWTVAAIVGVMLAVFGLKCLIWVGLHSLLTTQMSYALKYWYSPLPTNLDVFLIGFLLNPLLLAVRRSAKFGQGLTPRQVGWLKCGAIGLMALFYRGTAHHLYFQEQWSLALPSRGIRTSTTFFLLQPLTAVCTMLFIVAFELGDDAALRPKLTGSNLLQQPLRIVEVGGQLSYGVYIWHSPIIHKTIGIVLADDTRLPIEQFYQRLSLTLLLSSLFAAITYWVIERPALGWKRSTLERSINPTP